MKWTEFKCVDSTPTPGGEWAGPNVGKSNETLVAGTLCWSTLHQGDERIYRVVRIYSKRLSDGREVELADLDTVYRSDLTEQPPRKTQKPISRNVDYLVPLTGEELSRRIDVLSALRSALGGG